jgi:hypothetical protein
MDPSKGSLGGTDSVLFAGLFAHTEQPTSKVTRKWASQNAGTKRARKMSVTREVKEMQGGSLTSPHG